MRLLNDNLLVWIVELNGELRGENWLWRRWDATVQSYGLR